MATDMNVGQCWHTVVPTALGELTLVRNADALLGLYFPPLYRPSPVTFGPRLDEGLGEAVGQLGEYLAGQRRGFDLPLALRGREFQERCGTSCGRFATAKRWRTAPWLVALVVR